MAAEEILELFDRNWFFSKHKEASSLVSQRSNQESVETLESEDPEKPRESKIPLEEEDDEEEAFTPTNVLVGRSMSDQNLMSSKTSLFGSSEDMFSPTSVLNVKPQMGKLQTILSGKEVSDFLPEVESLEPEKGSDSAKETMKTKKKRYQVPRARRRKSLSDLEFQELKGFMDLGFVFSEEDHKDSDLVSILPGLQRLGRKDRDDKETEENREDEEEEEGEEEKRRRNRAARPYLSEAWEFQRERKEKKSSSAAMKWKVPAPANEADMKDQLKLWAHTVASTVR